MSRYSDQIKRTSAIAGVFLYPKIILIWQCQVCRLNHPNRNIHLICKKGPLLRSFFYALSTP